MHVDRPRLAVVGASTQPLEELPAREDDARARRQEDEHLELDERELHGLAADFHRSPWDVDTQLAALDDLLALASLVGRRGTTQERAHPAAELADRERLRDVVVRSELEAEDLVELLASSGEHDDRDVARTPEPLADLEAVQLGEHDVEHDEVHVLLLESLQRLLAVASLDNPVPVALERVGEQRLDRLLVVDEENGRGGLHERKRWTFGPNASEIAAYYSRGMDAARPPRRTRRPRRRAPEHVLDGRLVRITSLMLLPAALLVLLTLSVPGVLPPPPASPAFDGDSAAALSNELSRIHPTRVPGTPEAALAAAWYRQTISSLGLTADEDVWREEVPGLGEVELRNIVTVIRGRSASSVIVVANRDNVSPGDPADNPSGTATLIELARPYGTLGSTERPVPQRTLVLVSTDGGAWGGAGAARFAERVASRGDVAAVVILHGLARPGVPRLEVAAGGVASPARSLVGTASARIREQVGVAPELPSAAAQLVALGIPLAVGEQAPFLRHGMAAITVSGARSTPGHPVDARLRAQALTGLGRAAEALIGSIDATPRRSFGTADALFLGDRRVVGGWALRLLLAISVAPFAVGVVDLLARARRRGVPFLPALRALRSRALFWLYAGALLWLASAVGLLPAGSPLPFPPTGPAASDWSSLGMLLFAAALVVGWVVARRRLVPEIAPSSSEMLAGYVTALVWLGVLAVVVAVARPYAVLFLLPSLYAWLWLPGAGSRASRSALFLLGLMGPVAGLVILARSLDIALLDATRYLVELAGLGYIAPSSVVLALAWAAAAAQLGALALGRYAPYAHGVDQPPPGLVRSAIQRAVGRGAAARQASGM